MSSYYSLVGVEVLESRSQRCCVHFFSGLDSSLTCCHEKLWFLSVILIHQQEAWVTPQQPNLPGLIGSREQWALFCCKPQCVIYTDELSMILHKNIERLKSFLCRTRREATPLLTEWLSGITVGYRWFWICLLNKCFFLKSESVFASRAVLVETVWISNLCLQQRHC